MKVVLDPGAYMPEYAHYTDAGADLRSPVDMVIGPHDSATIDTGVHVEIPSGMVGMLKSKCKAYGVTCSSESDFAMRWPGCGLFNKPVSGQTVEDSWKRSYARMNRESDLSGEKEIPGQLKLES